jgi:hypothetical protein
MSNIPTAGALAKGQNRRHDPLTKGMMAIEICDLERYWIEYDACPRNARFIPSSSYL